MMMFIKPDGIAEVFPSGFLFQDAIPRSTALQNFIAADRFRGCSGLALVLIISSTV